MKIFGQLIRTAVNTALLPVAIAKDVVTLGGTLTEQNPDFSGEHTHTAEAIQRLKDEAGEDDE